MPYVDQESRHKLLEGKNPETSGELTYVIYSEILKYLDTKGSNWQAYSDILGALEGAKLEIYRRRVAPHEDSKIQENGDV